MAKPPNTASEKTFNSLMGIAKAGKMKPEEITTKWVQAACVMSGGQVMDEVMAEGTAVLLRNQLVNDMVKQKSPALALASNLLQGAWDAGKEKTLDTILADQFLADSFKVPNAFGIGALKKPLEDVMVRYRIAMRKANRFVLDDQLTELVTEVSNTAAIDVNKILRWLHSAVVPYETTWIEFDLHVKVAKMRTLAPLLDPFDGYDKVPPRMGLLIQRDVNVPTAFAITLVTQMIKNDGANALTCPQPVVYLFDAGKHPERVAGYEKYWAISDYAQSTAWGYSTDFDQMELSPEQRKQAEYFKTGTPKSLLGYMALAAAPLHQVLMNYAQKRTGVSDKMRLGLAEDFVASARENSGMLRWVIVLLSMLAEVPVRHSGLLRMPGKHRVGPLRKPFMDFHKISIKLPKTRPVAYVMRKLDQGTGRRNRAHEVRSHWRTYMNEMQERCAHEWAYDEGNGYRLCGRCMAYGRLIKEHIRGDAELGWVRKDYVLEANPSAPQIHKSLPEDDDFEDQVVIDMMEKLK